MLSGFPVFDNQPALREVEQFILADLGTHILDVARFLHGEANRLYCQTQRTLDNVRGENVATVVLNCGDGRTTVTCNMAYAGNALERECFPQTLVMIEGTRGSVEIAPGYDLRVTTKSGTRKHSGLAANVSVGQPGLCGRAIQHRGLPSQSRPRPPGPEPARGDDSRR